MSFGDGSGSSVDVALTIKGRQCLWVWKGVSRGEGKERKFKIDLRILLQKAANEIQIVWNEIRKNMESKGHLISLQNPLWDENATQ
eukprot:2124812-Amphidinium_carterae.1